VVEGDDEDLALTLNGKKKRIRRKDFLDAFRRFKMDQKSIENIFRRFENSLVSWENFIHTSFLPEEMKLKYIEMLTKKARQIGIIN
jgi:serine/threonine-protein kinase HipA